jgi:hypothetical protein
MVALCRALGFSILSDPQQPAMVLARLQLAT